jgi:DnaJ-class molecular chaperone
MSRYMQILEVSPPEHSADSETEKQWAGGFKCPTCNGFGCVWNEKKYPDDPDMVDCARCGGRGKLRAEITIRWEAEE